MVAKTRGSNCYLEFISNSNVTDNSTSWRRNLFFRTFRTNTNRTDHCSVRVGLEQNFLEPLPVRFEPNTKRTGGLFGSATLEQCLCSVRSRTEQTEQTRTCTVRQAISAFIEFPPFLYADDKRQTTIRMPFKRVYIPIRCDESAGAIHSAISPVAVP